MDTGNYSHTIARELVHKRSVAEVLITAMHTRQGSWTCHAQLPREHSFHGDARGAQQAYHDPLLVMEAFRQACIAAGHLAYDVPLDSHYTVRFYELTILDLAALRHRDRPLDLEFTVTVRNEYRSGLEVTAVATHQETKVMELAGAYGWMSAAKWAGFRAGASWDPGPQPVAAAPALVGRHRGANVVIGEPDAGINGGLRAPLVVDIGHPIIFDHPHDHLPGGLIIEACRQLSTAVLGPEGTELIGPAWVRCDFHSFAELDAVATVAVAPADNVPLGMHGEITQSGQLRATVDMTFTAGPT
ncbi:AfsA-related hotdog domain-containing protein [Mycobacterium sp. C31M]